MELRQLPREQGLSALGDVTGGDPKRAYIYLQLPGDNTARGRMVEHYVYALPGGRGGMTENNRR